MTNVYNFAASGHISEEDYQGAARVCLLAADAGVLVPSSGGDEKLISFESILAPVTEVMLLKSVAFHRDFILLNLYIMRYIHFKKFIAQLDDNCFNYIGCSSKPNF